MKCADPDCRVCRDPLPPEILQQRIQSAIASSGHDFPRFSYTLKVAASIAWLAVLGLAAWVFTIWLTG